jgi:DNA replication protein DnaD
MNKQQTIELLQKQIPGFYSLEQVINIIKDIEDTVEVRAEISDELIESIVDEIADEGRDLMGDYQLEMYHNEVEIAGMDVDRDVIKRAIKSALDNQ